MHRNDATAQRRTVRSELHWRGHRTDHASPVFVGELAALRGVLVVKWKT
jgi:hypothetical protein